MDRLTKRGKGICVGLSACFDECDHAVSGCDCARVRGALNRLAAYEDTGLEPDEIPHWIPVSERLPEKWHNENGEPIEFNVMLPEAKDATTLCFNGSQWFEFDWKYMRITGYYSVTHWQPLPQPPKGENNEH